MAYDATQRKIPRQIDGTMKEHTHVGAMMDRAKDGQWRADFSPDAPVGFNFKNPEPGYVFRQTKDGIVKEPKHD